MSHEIVVKPNESSIHALAGNWALAPMWVDLPIDSAIPEDVFEALTGGGPGILLESLDLWGQPGPHTIVGWDPVALVEVDQEGLRFRDQVRELPLEGGWAGTPGDPAGAQRRGGPFCPGYPVYLKWRQTALRRLLRHGHHRSGGSRRPDLVAGDQMVR